MLSHSPQRTYYMLTFSQHISMLRTIPHPRQGGDSSLSVISTGGFLPTLRPITHGHDADGGHTNMLRKRQHVVRTLRGM